MHIHFMAFAFIGLFSISIRAQSIEIIPRAGSITSLPSINGDNTFRINPISKTYWSLGTGLYAPLKSNWVAGVDLDLFQKGYGFNIDGNLNTDNSYRQMFLSIQPNIGYKLIPSLLIHFGPYFETSIGNESNYDKTNEVWQKSTIPTKSEIGLATSLQVFVKKVNIKLAYMHSLTNRNALTFTDANGGSSSTIKNYQQSIVFQIGYRINTN
jgi:hypothetical protein